MSGRGRAAGVLLAGQAAYRGAVAAYTIVLVHRLGRAEYGDLSYLLALATIVVVVADGGISRLLVRDVARAGGARLVRPLLALRATWVALLALVAAGAGVLAGLPGPGWIVAVLVAFVVFDALASGFEAAAVGAERPWRVAAPQLAGAAVLLAATGAFAAGADASLGLAFGLLAGAAAVRMAGGALAWRAQVTADAEPLTPATARRWARQAAPFLALALLGVVYHRLDMVILHARRGPEEAASYGAAFRVVDALLVLTGVAAASVSAHLSRLHADAPERVLHAWRTYLARAAVVLVPSLAVLALLAPQVAALAFGERYRDPAGADLRLLAPGMLFVSLQVLNAAVLFTSDLQRGLVRIAVAQVAFNAALTYWLAGRAGSEGAALATSVSEALTFAAFAVLLRRRLRPGRQGPTRTGSRGTSTSGA